jgi:hypothetical protein
MGLVLASDPGPRGTRPRRARRATRSQFEFPKPARKKGFWNRFDAMAKAARWRDEKRKASEPTAGESGVSHQVQADEIRSRNRRAARDKAGDGEGILEP